jgi:regulator of cell morphogenesis and NO signaling
MLQLDPDFPINQIMQRYDLNSSKDLLYSYEELRRMNIDQQFIYALLQTFEDEKQFSPDTYQDFSLEVIMDYICRSHKYYLNTRLLEIEQSINILMEDYADGHPLLEILRTFFADYSSSLAAHIRAEEKHLLPHIKNLLGFRNDPDAARSYFSDANSYPLRTFIDSHQDTEKDLSEVRNAIEEYHPPATNQTPYRILLTQLHAFERDLMVHALVEDKVLIPRALQLEETVMKTISRLV